jgi:hypothetical protein
MIVVPGETSADTISAIIADEAAIGVVNTKTTAVRIIPAPGKKIGDIVEFGGLLGSGPVMKVSSYGSSEFIKRGGRIGAQATILPGKIINEEGMVAAGSVVTKNVEERKIVAGNPAVFMKDVPEDQLLENQ